MDGKRIERRTDKHGVIVSMAAAKGYVMVRRPGCIPFVMHGREWELLPLEAKGPLPPHNHNAGPALLPACSADESLG